MEWGFQLYNACLSDCTFSFGMSFNEIYSFHYYMSILRISKTNFPLLALVLTRYYQNGVVFSDSHNDLYRTSGARDIILVKFLSRNSLATGPNILVPLGSFLSVKITAAFSSNLIYEPSGRRYG
jgi:hypothetical protein